MGQIQGMDIGQIGVWTFQFEQTPWRAVAEAAAELDELGYGAIWFPESRGREVMSQSAMLLDATRRAVIAPGIASIYARDAFTMAAGQRTLSEAHPGRFLLGLGVSHAPMVENVRGHQYGRPVATMRAYLDAMDAAPYGAPRPATAMPRVLAALGPKMLELAASHANGAHPYFTTVEHTAFARRVLGPAPLLAVEATVVVEPDPTRAREVARNFAARYLALDNYANNLRRVGYAEDDLANGGSDRLIDAVIGWGDLDAVVARVRAHLDAGADHVCVQVLPHDPTSLPRQEWHDLAAALIRES